MGICFREHTQKIKVSSLALSTFRGRTVLLCCSSITGVSVSLCYFAKSVYFLDIFLGVIHGEGEANPPNFTGVPYERRKSDDKEVEEAVRSRRQQDGHPRVVGPRTVPESPVRATTRAVNETTADNRTTRRCCARRSERCSTTPDTVTSMSPRYHLNDHSNLLRGQPDKCVSASLHPGHLVLAIVGCERYFLHDFARYLPHFSVPASSQSVCFSAISALYIIELL
ncbi:hypothetical protein HPB48_021394 [Haemaphysalis longicornis]|uniref:Uncharacterized protein n=1 Tax=Haemaphysalis longicornis TaxID=44386 RepID=A0A9J6FZH6_HAELO|nr:hypothetical protein HPB48_021394 [Haemaphysalis longicornis]